MWLLQLLSRRSVHEVLCTILQFCCGIFHSFHFHFILVLVHTVLRAHTYLCFAVYDIDPARYQLSTVQLTKAVLGLASCSALFFCEAN